MGILNFSKEYTGGGILNTVKSFLPIVCGVPESAFSSMAKGRYSVVFKATPKDTAVSSIVIGAWLQEKIKFEVSSEWEPLVDMSGISSADNFFQLFGVSINSTFSSRRKWKGSQPISIFFNLRFEALSDTKKEVIEPCLRLQQLALPTRGAVNVSGESFLLQPPGPNPFYLEAASSIKVGGHQLFGAGEVIEIDVGQGFLKFGTSSDGNGVVIKNVKVEFDNRMSEDGPIGATVNLEIQTYEMLTRDKLAKIYNMEESSATTNIK